MRVFSFWLLLLNKVYHNRINKIAYLKKQKEENWSFFKTTSNDQNSKCAENGSNENQQNADDGQILQAKAIELLPFESRCLGDFLDNRRKPYLEKNQEAGRDGGNRHHKGIRQEIKEIQELHLQHRDVSQASITKGRKRTQDQADYNHQHTTSTSLPPQFICKGRDGRFQKCNAACKSR